MERTLALMPSLGAYLAWPSKARPVNQGKGRGITKPPVRPKRGRR